MSYDYTFKGWMGLDKNAVGNMVHQEFKPKPFEDTDVDIQITHSGICASDIHTLRSGWTPADYPVCVGHEIVGRAVRVGSKAERGTKVGDRVGVGAQANSCLRPDCYECSSDEEQYCTRQTQTFNSKFADGSKQYGGYANYHRCPSHFVFKIPDEIPGEAAAPMLCGGVTVFSPLIHNGCGPGKKVGIIGVGGLGHFGILFAKALGADKVVAVSRTNSKKKDAMQMGADHFIATDEDKNWHKANMASLDLIICTVSSEKMPLSRYLMLLGTHGQFIQVGAPEDRLPAFNAFSLIAKGAKMGGSAIGSPKDIMQMLDLAAKQRVKPWIQQRPMNDANQATVDMDDGKARYRYVLVNESSAKL